jgi:pimeloyl-ACP methyl ester carboxylesterase
MKISVDGREAYAYTGGKPFDATLPCVAFVHGALHDHSVWSLQSRALAHHGHAVLAVDLPGHGRSAGPAPASVEAAADWLVDLLAAAGVRRVALVGHSMGSLIALSAAARLAGSDLDIEPTRLVMIGSAFPMKVAPALLETALAAPLEAIDRVNALSISTLAAKPSQPGPGSWLHGGNRALMRRMQAGYAAAGHGNLFHHDFSVCDRYGGALEAAARLRCPVRLILGAKDAMTPPKASQALAAALRAEVTTLPAGHSLMAEAPDGVLAALQATLA